MCLRHGVAVMCTLAEHGLALGETMKLFGSQNNGNYHGLLKLFATYISPDDGLPVECFPTSLGQENHSDESMTDIVVNYLIKVCKADFM